MSSGHGDNAHADVRRARTTCLHCSDQLNGAGYVARSAEEPIVRALQYHGRTEVREPSQVAPFGMVQGGTWRHMPTLPPISRYRSAKAGGSTATGSSTTAPRSIQPVPPMPPWRSGWVPEGATPLVRSRRAKAPERGGHVVRCGSRAVGGYGQDKRAGPPWPIPCLPRVSPRSMRGALAWTWCVNNCPISCEVRHATRQNTCSITGTLFQRCLSPCRLVTAA